MYHVKCYKKMQLFIEITSAKKIAWDFNFKTEICINISVFLKEFRIHKAKYH